MTMSDRLSGQIRVVPGGEPLPDQLMGEISLYDEDGLPILLSSSSEPSLSVIEASGSDRTLDADSHAIYDVTLDDDCTFVFETERQATQFTMVLRQDGVGGHTVTLPASVKWHEDTPPTILTSADAVHVLEFLTVSNGGSWRGFLASSNIS